ncbi:outer membrane protein assembly factor BamC [Quatrionicoccus australiensis]|uniref:outer membrane protein assembly factor BamC n=1 Tax=Quatrionicoccus australiensis TaxID=138118 RepID=UPI001CF9A463|nr:outer membrane protein assembly factor BamC [Quatrionicoccus australiensis]MCB4359220.1 outer membrane protein assembly factor BamC [Quatrionicoccus australiensis]
MNRRLHSLSLSLLVLALTGCSMIPEARKIDYKSAGKVPTLEVPPDLSQVARDDRYAVPDANGKGSATFSAYTADRSVAGQAQNSVVLPQVDKVRVERSGNQRWLVVAVPADKLWDTVKDFWQETGFIIKQELPDAGVMETDWAENRAKIGDDFIRNTLGGLLDSLYSTGERDKFRTRFEAGAEPGTTDIFISHRAMEEVYTSSAKDETRWQPRQPDPELEAEMLRRLMVRLGSEEKRAEVSIAAAKAEPRAKMAKADDGAGTLEVLERFDRAWRRVGLALDRVGFTVEDRDRSRGLYFVRYVDPDADNTKKDDGFFSKLAFWKGKDAAASSKVQYRVHLNDVGSITVVQVLTSEGGTDRSDTAKKILALLYQQLQ